MQAIYILFVGAVVLWGCHQQSPATQPERQPFRARLEQGVRDATAGASDRLYTNVKNVREEWMERVATAKEENLQKPVLLVGAYYPREPLKNRVACEVAWMEDGFTLREVLIVNPATGKSVAARIQDDDIPIWQKESRWSIFFRYIFFVPEEHVGTNADQILEVRLPDGQSAKLYPRVRKERD
jgi:hypothetical protein